MPTPLDEAGLLDLLREEIAEVAGIDGSTVGPSANLAEDYDVDSLELMEIATRLEDRLGVRLDPADLKDTTTVGDVVGYLGDVLRARA
ncbi:acyl carrier protein [Actinomadura rayongensis]|uniref:Acyl carrier protein n=1 Tax=Actinomadura rayongensis TaxID=1429076 RepID=A0A6I4W9G6_9ACTN|nr:acyl carrier protein [Actinomadura rayongensis]MXQ66268.1 acyl carrier protein [Actinomadura rayongensis]